MSDHEEHVPEEQPVDDELTEEQSTEEQSTEEQPTEEQSTEEQTAEEQSTEEQSTEEQSTEEQSTEEQTAEEQSTEDQASEEHPAESGTNLDLYAGADEESPQQSPEMEYAHRRQPARNRYGRPMPFSVDDDVMHMSKARDSEKRPHRQFPREVSQEPPRSPLSQTLDPADIADLIPELGEDEEDSQSAPIIAPTHSMAPPPDAVQYNEDDEDDLKDFFEREAASFQQRTLERDRRLSQQEVSDQSEQSHDEGAHQLAAGDGPPDDHGPSSSSSFVHEDRPEDHRFEYDRSHDESWRSGNGGDEREEEGEQQQQQQQSQQQEEDVAPLFEAAYVAQDFERPAVDVVPYVNNMVGMPMKALPLPNLQINEIICGLMKRLLDQEDISNGLMSSLQHQQNIITKGAERNRKLEQLRQSTARQLRAELRREPDMEKAKYDQLVKSEMAKRDDVEDELREELGYWKSKAQRGKSDRQRSTERRETENAKLKRELAAALDSNKALSAKYERVTKANLSRRPTEPASPRATEFSNLTAPGPLQRATAPPLRDLPTVDEASTPTPQPAMQVSESSLPQAEPSTQAPETFVSASQHMMNALETLKVASKMLASMSVSSPPPQTAQVA